MDKSLYNPWEKKTVVPLAHILILLEVIILEGPAHIALHWVHDLRPNYLILNSLNNTPQYINIIFYVRYPCTTRLNGNCLLELFDDVPRQLRSIPVDAVLTTTNGLEWHVLNRKNWPFT